MKRFITQLLKGQVRFAMPHASHLIHKGEHFFHMSYLGAVGWEAHGTYRYCAIALLVTIIMELFVQEVPATEGATE